MIILVGENIPEFHFCDECGEPTDPNESYCLHCGAALKEKENDPSLNKEINHFQTPNISEITNNKGKSTTEQIQQPESILYVPPKKKKKTTNIYAIISISFALSPFLFYLLTFLGGRLIFMIMFIIGPALMGGAFYYGVKGYRKERLRILAMLGILISLAGFGFYIYFFVSFMSGMG